MIRLLRDAFGGGTSKQAAAAAAAADAAVGRGMADVLAALGDVIDDDAALAGICAGLGENVPGAGSGRRAAAAAREACVPAGVPGSDITSARAGEPAASRRGMVLGSAAAATAVLTAGAVAVAVIGVPGAGRGGTGRRGVNTAYVIKHVDSALSAADPGAIAQMTVTTKGTAASGGRDAPAAAEEWSYGDRWRAVTYSAAGHVLFDEGSTAASVDTVVSYRARTWARQHESGRPAVLAPGARGCEPVVAALPLLFLPGLPDGGLSASWLPSSVAKDLRTALSCGNLASAGKQRVDGTEAIKLTSSPDSMIPETIWVSPGTYLPLRVVIRPAPGTQGPSQSANITWLKPTAQNLASLTVPIPAGFRRIPLAEAVRSTSHATRVWTRL